MNMPVYTKTRAEGLRKAFSLIGNNSSLHTWGYSRITALMLIIKNLGKAFKNIEMGENLSSTKGIDADPFPIQKILMLVKHETKIRKEIENRLRITQQNTETLENEMNKIDDNVHPIQ